MKIDMEKFTRMQNNSSYYHHWDVAALDAFGKPTGENGRYYNLFSTRMHERYARSNVFQLTFDTNGVRLESPAGGNDETKIRVGEVKQIVDYVWKFAERLYDNGFLIGSNQHEDATDKNEVTKEAAKLLLEDMFKHTYRQYWYSSLKDVFEDETRREIKRLIEPDKEKIIEKATKQAVLGIQNTKRFKETFSACCCCNRGCNA